MKIGKRVEICKGMKFSRLKIMIEVLQKYFTKVENDAPNEAYTLTGYEGIVFMIYEENGDKYVTILNGEDYEAIKGTLWEGFNEYIVDKQNHRIYLHRVLCPGGIGGMIVHHKGNRFDNRSSMLEAVTPKEHDQHRTYFGDMIISVR